MALIDLDTHIISEELFEICTGLIGAMGDNLEVITCRINSFPKDDSNFKDRFKAIINQNYTIHLNTLFSLGYPRERFELLIFDFSKIEDDSICSFSDVKRFEKKNTKPSVVAYFMNDGSVSRRVLQELMKLYEPC